MARNCQLEFPRRNELQASRRGEACEREVLRDDAAMNRPLWDDQAWTASASLESDVTADVCVIGLGGSGLAALEELHARGVNAIGLDAGAVGAGAAGRNGGFVLAGLAKFYHQTVADHGREVAAEIYRATAAEIQRQAERRPELFQLNGSLRLAAEAEEIADCRAHLAALVADGFPAEWYRGPEGEGILLPTDGVFQPLARVRTMARQLREAGAGLWENSPVTDLRFGEVVTPRGRVKCAWTIVAVDGRLEVLLPELAPRVRTARLQMLGTAPAPEVKFPRPVYWRHGYEYWQQRADGTIALGGFRDHALAEEWTRDATPTARVQALLEQFLREKLGVRAEITHRWAASVAYTEDNLPVLEEVRPGVWACGAYSGTGNIVGALCGRAVAELAMGETSRWANLLARARA